MDSCFAYLEEVRKVEEFRTAQILHAIYDVHGAKIGNRSVKVDDFILKPIEERQVQDIDEKLREFFAGKIASK